MLLLVWIVFIALAEETATRLELQEEKNSNWMFNLLNDSP
jgi:hypothetical protein